MRKYTHWNEEKFSKVVQLIKDGRYLAEIAEEINCTARAICKQVDKWQEDEPYRDNHGKKWREKDDNIIRQAAIKRQDRFELEPVLGRKLGAILWRENLLEILPPQEQQEITLIEQPDLPKNNGDTKFQQIMARFDKIDSSIEALQAELHSSLPALNSIARLFGLSRTHKVEFVKKDIQ